MFEHRAFGESVNTLRTGPVAGLAPFNTTSGFMHLVAITDCVLANVVLKNPYGTPDGAVTLPAGSQLPAVRSFDLTSGQLFIASL